MYEIINKENGWDHTTKVDVMEGSIEKVSKEERVIADSIKTSKGSWTLALGGSKEQILQSRIDP